MRCWRSCASLVWAGIELCRGRAYPDPSGEDHRAVRGRRPERLRGAASGRQAVAEPRPAILCRGPSRRRRQYRHDPGRRAPRPTAIRSWWRVRASWSIRASTPTSPTIRTRISPRSRWPAASPNIVIGASLGSGQNGQGTDRAACRPIPANTPSPMPGSAPRRSSPPNCSSSTFKLDQPSVPYGGGAPGDPGRCRQSNADRFCAIASGRAAHPGRHVCAASP